MGHMTVGEAARAVGVSSRAIRLWEAKGLIPSPTRTDAGYRLFTDSDLELLRFIDQAKTLGLGLNEIRDIVETQNAGASPCDRVMQAIDGHILRIDRAVADLLRLRQTLTGVQRTYGTSVCGEGMCPMITGVSADAAAQDG